ncbi:hypothetical protein FB382_001980 [Nocardioides ginsengisegetis]|uniref:Uncharacterized protein n=1 Tax=Nocardioides ginsengisegetis TaxID=661491 RepID=A0A7W3J012_9ACTN|nr:hypothetical protein [Nocardioides ginsengisegetis]MBA8803689.1 hypothetical protein [Nocardioides ginsengisegetis]
MGIRSARRRRVAGAVGGTTAAVLAVAFGIAALTGATSPNTNDGPPPANSGTPTPTISASSTRPIVYSDDVLSDHCRGNPIGCIGILHVGDREVRIDQALWTVRGWPLGVTDAGVVYAHDDGSVWFTDGGSPRRIATQTCAGTSPTSVGGLATGDAGPWAAWFDCTPTHRGDLVVFDTSAGQEVARAPIPPCRSAALPCTVDAIIGEHVYVKDDLLRLDVRTGTVVAATPQMYDEDLRSHPRAFVLGDSWRTGTPVAGLDFDVVGSRLVPTDPQPGPEPRRTRAFDIATGRPVEFRLPSGYHPDPTPTFHGNDVAGYVTVFTAFEWLDDDTVALTQEGEELPNRDIITCRLSDGHCDVAVTAGAPDRWRIVIGEALP